MVDNLRRAQKIYNHYGYNVLNTSDPFYSNICLPIKSENGTDVLLESRFEYYYNNASLCEDNCSIDDINLNTSRVKCKCQCKTQFNVYSETTFLSITNAKVNNTALSYMACYQNVFAVNIFNGNIGNYCMLIVGVIQLVICVYYISRSDKIVLSLMSSALPDAKAANPPRKVDQILDYINNQSYPDIDIESEDNSVESEPKEIKKEKEEVKNEKVDKEKNLNKDKNADDENIS